LLRNIPENKVISRIQLENPWWGSGEIDAAYRRLRPRAYFERFSQLVRDVQDNAVRRAPILMGPRRVGKTVLLFHLIQSVIDGGLDPKRICYVSVEHPVYNGLGLDDLVRLGCAASGTADQDLAGRIFVFDEIQYLKDWELHMKTLVDTYPRTVWIASGSAAAALRLKSHESGAGRFTDFLLPPLTFHEYVTLLGREDVVTPPTSPSIWFTTADLDGLNQLFVDYLNFGGYPEVALSEAIRADPGRYVRQDIIDKVLLRDLPSLYGIADIQELNSLFTALAYNTANEISLDTLSQRAGIAKNTVKRYLEYLEAAFLVKRVQRVGQDGRQFQRAHHFKAYLTNPSLRAALFSPIDADDPDMGAMVETAIFGQWFHGTHDDLHYARWKGGEVDLVHCSSFGEVTWACEVKWSDRFAESPRELDSLIMFCKTHALREAIVTTRTRTRHVDVDGLQLDCLPASLYCYTIGHNAVRGEPPTSSGRHAKARIARPLRPQA
jgi:predicted AAA+ superfamily ATPase